MPSCMTASTTWCRRPTAPQVVHRVAVAADARDPGDPADPEGRAHARGGRPDPRRGRPPDGRRRPAERARAASCSSISARPTRTSGRSCLGRQDREARRHRIEGSVEFDDDLDDGYCGRHSGALPPCRPAAKQANDCHDRSAGDTQRPSLARRARGLSQAARADRPVPRLLGRPAAGAVRLDAAGLDARGRRRSRHHRAVRAGRHALHHQVPLGAAGRCARRAGAVAAARPPARLAGVLATPADGGDRVPRVHAIRRPRPGWSRSARCWSRPPRRRRTS